MNFQVSTACKWFESTPLTSGPPVTSALKTYIRSLAFGSIIEDELWEGKLGSNDSIMNHENGYVDGGEVTEARYSRDMKVRD